MKLSINIVTYNRKNELLRALDSLIVQSFIDYEIIIIDNASTDCTQDAINDYKEKHNTIQIKYEKQNLNLGVAGGRNRAFQLSKGEYIFTFDDDAIIEDKDFLFKSINMLDKDNTIAAAAVKIFEPHINKYLSYTMRDINGKKNVLSFKGGANFISKEFYSDLISLYPQKLFFGAEELFPCLIAWGKGRRVAFFEDLEVLHLPSKINRYSGKDRSINLLVNTYIIYRLVYPCVIHPLLYILLIARLIKHGIFREIKKVNLTIKERYDKKERKRIRMKGLLTLINIFGFKKVF